MPALTQQDVDDLRLLLGTTWDDDPLRADFYLAYYELIKDVDQDAADQVLLQAHLTTYSGFYGGVKERGQVLHCAFSVSKIGGLAVIIGQA